MGQYTPLSFWAVALLFASEHGPYWEVGLIAGVAYNWWMVRTRNLADCILAHAVTNALLAAYVLRVRPVAILAVGRTAPIRAASCATLFLHTLQKEFVSHVSKVWVAAGRGLPRPCFA